MKSCHEKVLVPTILCSSPYFSLANKKQSPAQAAQQIFRTRNSPQSLMRGQVDLHGLHVAEAQECISVIVPILEQMNVKHVHIITGSGMHFLSSNNWTFFLKLSVGFRLGHHTVGPQRGVARLMPSVQSTLDDMGYKTVPVKDANGKKEIKRK